MQSSLIFIIFSLVLVTFCMTPDNEVSTVSNKNNTINSSENNLVANFDSDFYSQVPYDGSLEGAKLKAKISSGETFEDENNIENENPLLIQGDNKEIKLDWKNGTEVTISELELGDCFVDFSPHLESNHFQEKVLLVSCDEYHNSQVIHKQPFKDIYQDPLVLEVESSLRCNQARSFFGVVEYVDEKYSDYLFFTEPIFDPAAVHVADQKEIICISYFEQFNYEEAQGVSGITLNETFELDKSGRVKSFINWSFFEDVNYWILGTSWQDEHDFGVACHSPGYLSDPFHAEFLLYFAQPWGAIREMNFVYQNSEITISIDMLEILSNFTKEGEEFMEQIFYYFMPISQVSTYGILSLDDLDFLDLIFSELPENVSGEFSYVSSEGEKFTASCSMDDDF